MNLDDVMALEGEAESLEEYAVALQRSIDSGMAWSGPGRMGRAAMDGMDQGLVMLAVEATKDYYGNVIPGRGDVAPGTKGSRELVVEIHGEEWAVMLEGSAS